MVYDISPMDNLQEKKIFLEKALENNHILFFEHDKDIECCTLKRTEKGIEVDRLMKYWRNRYGEKVQDRLPESDVDLLLGDMWIWGDEMASERNAYNLHPALPGGPKGEWYQVIWDLIEKDEEKTGVMIHKVIPELDEGPAVSYAQFPIRGSKFDYFWTFLPSDPDQRQNLIDQERSLRGKTRHPLHKEIRSEGFAREIPLVIQTTKALAEGKGGIEGNPLDLTEKIDAQIRPMLEGSFVRREMV